MCVYTHQHDVVGMFLCEVDRVHCVSVYYYLRSHKIIENQGRCSRFVNTRHDVATMVILILRISRFKKIKYLNVILTCAGDENGPDHLLKLYAKLPTYYLAT